MADPLEQAARETVEPLSYEQEVHALLWHAATTSEDLIQYFRAQAANEKGDAKKLTNKCIDNEMYHLERIRKLIPQALERRDARSPALRREIEKEVKREIAASIRESLPRRNSVGEFSRFADELERESQ